MFMHFAKTLMRVAARSRMHSVITVAGLAIGLAVCLLALVAVWQETHYDQHHPHADRLYMVETNVQFPGREAVLRNVSMAPLAEALKEAGVGVEQTTRVRNQWHTYWRGDNLDVSSPAFFVDPSFLEMFPLEFLAGSNDTAFTTPNSVLLSESMAERFFGQENALGQTISASKTHDLTVTGVFKDLPESTHMAFDFVMPMNAPHIRFSDTHRTSWQQLPVMTYFRLAEDAPLAPVEAALKRLADDRVEASQTNEAGDKVTLRTSLIAVPDIYLEGGPYPAQFKAPGDSEKLAGLAVIGALVLVVACFNHVNIFTARAMARAREVALRKVVGASRGQLIVQFLSEAAFYCLLAWGVALAATELLLPSFAELLGRTLNSELLWQADVLGAQIALLVVVILVSGIYPAFYLSRFTPEGVMKTGAANIGSGRFNLRAILVVMQFAISIGLVISAAVIFAQTKFTQNKDLGFDAENLMVLHGVRRSPAGTIALTSALDKAISAQPGIVSVSGASAMPSWDFHDEARMRLEGQGAEEYRSIGKLSVDMDYLETYRVPVIAGRGFSDEYAADRLQWQLEERDGTAMPVVVNERMLRTLGINDAASAVGAGAYLEVNPGSERQVTIVGVIQDFHFRSLRSAISPMVLYPDPSAFNTLTVRIDPAQRDVALRSIEEGWRQVLPAQSVNPDFVDRDIVGQYQAEEQQLLVVGLLAGLAVVIAMLGLYGLAAFSIERRIKEIGIRKVLGARIEDIVRLMVWQFSKPVIAANLIAWPMAWYFARTWLDSFAYRIDLTPIPFLAAGGLALFVAGAIVAGQAIRTSHANPIHALRYE